MSKNQSFKSYEDIICMDQEDMQKNLILRMKHDLESLVKEMKDHEETYRTALIGSINSAVREKARGEDVNMGKYIYLLKIWEKTLDFEEQFDKFKLLEDQTGINILEEAIYAKSTSDWAEKNSGPTIFPPCTLDEILEIMSSV